MGLVPAETARGNFGRPHLCNLHAAYAWWRSMGLTLDPTQHANVVIAELGLFHGLGLL